MNLAYLFPIYLCLCFGYLAFMIIRWKVIDYRARHPKRTVKKEIPANIMKPLTRWQRINGFRMVGEFITVKVESYEVACGDWRWSGTRTVNAWAYYCPDCGNRLAEGPSGGASVNCVCKTCRVNFGSLPCNEFE